MFQEVFMAFRGRTDKVRTPYKQVAWMVSLAAGSSTQNCNSLFFNACATYWLISASVPAPAASVVNQFLTAFIESRDFDGNQPKRAANTFCNHQG